MRPALFILGVCGLLVLALWYLVALAGSAPAPGPVAVFLGAVLAVWVATVPSAHHPLLFLPAGGFLLLPLFFPHGWEGILPAAVVGLLLWRSALPDPWRRRAPDPLRLVLCRTAAFPHAPVALAGEERFLHLHVLGPTGAGKSSAVLLPMILQDLDRPEAGLTLFDPQSDPGQKNRFTPRPDKMGNRGKPRNRDMTRFLFDTLSLRKPKVKFQPI